MWNVGEKTRKWLWWEKLKKRDNLEDLGVIEKKMSPIQMDLQEIVGKVWTGFIWLRMG
jgi:hypothetical protein